MIKKGKERKLKNENVYNVQNTGGTQKIVIEERRQYIQFHMTELNNKKMEVRYKILKLDNKTKNYYKA